MGDVQRRSREWYDLWVRYCDDHGGGQRDPRKHTTGFLTNFLDHVASIDDDGISEDAIAPPVIDEEVDEEHDVEQSEEADEQGDGHDEVMQMSHEQLVTRVEDALWRSRVDAEAWHDFCDARAFGASRDPSTHDEAFL